MSSVCISNCIHDASDPHVPGCPRPTYTNLHKWPGSDAQFVESVRRGESPKVVDCISCRQMYLRSYPLTKEETTKCFGMVKYGDQGKKMKMKMRMKKKKKKKGRRFRRRRLLLWRKVKKVLSCAAFFGFFRRLMFCSARVDVIEQKELL